MAKYYLLGFQMNTCRGKEALTRKVFDKALEKGTKETREGITSIEDIVKLCGCQVDLLIQKILKNYFFVEKNH